MIYIVSVVMLSRFLLRIYVILFVRYTCVTHTQTNTLSHIVKNMHKYIFEQIFFSLFYYLLHLYIDMTRYIEILIRRKYISR